MKTKKTKNIIFVVFMSIIMITSGFALSIDLLNKTSELSPLVIVFGHSEAENSAVADLIENYPNARVLEFNSIDMLSSIRLTEDPIVWVGHSTLDGINFQERLIEWDLISDFIKNSASEYHFFLACDSSKITDLTLTTGKYVYSFGVKIDALFGANIISILISRLFNLGNWAKFFAKALSRLTVNEDDSEYLPMYIYNQLGTNEAIIHGVNAVLLFAAIFFTLSAATMGGTLTARWSVYVLAGGAAYMLMLILQIYNAAVNGDVAGVVAKLGPLIIAFFAYGNFVIAALDWLTKILIASLFAADMAATPPKMPMYPAIIILAVGLSLWSIIKFIDDSNDCDDVAFYSPGCAPPPTPPGPTPCGLTPQTIDPLASIDRC